MPQSRCHADLVFVQRRLTGRAPVGRTRVLLSSGLLLSELRIAAAAEPMTCSCCGALAP
jgi:hypothetical protein